MKGTNFHFVGISHVKVGFIALQQMQGLHIVRNFSCSISPKQTLWIIYGTTKYEKRDYNTIVTFVYRLRNKKPKHGPIKKWTLVLAPTRHDNSSLCNSLILESWRARCSLDYVGYSDDGLSTAASSILEEHDVLWAVRQSSTSTVWPDVTTTRPPDFCRYSHILW